MDKEKFNNEKLKYLSRISEIDADLEKDIIKIIKFVECINNYKIGNGIEDIFYNKEALDFYRIRDDVEQKTNNFNTNVKKIINNFYEKEDDFCIVPIVLDK